MAVASTPRPSPGPTTLGRIAASQTGSRQTGWWPQERQATLTDLPSSAPNLLAGEPPCHPPDEQTPSHADQRAAATHEHFTRCWLSHEAFLALRIVRPAVGSAWGWDSRWGP